MLIYHCYCASLHFSCVCFGKVEQRYVIASRYIKVSHGFFVEGAKMAKSLKWIKHAKYLRGWRYHNLLRKY